ncbi:putative germin-like protein 2-1 [Quercus suber]|uniref:putative germin-like protein 2-1 n=1 Tax=Quercus suber TaxID=58331 RepID=UPI0032DEC1EF
MKLGIIDIYKPKVDSAQLQDSQSTTVAMAILRGSVENVEKLKKTGSFCIKKKSLKVVKKRNVKTRLVHIKAEHHVFFGSFFSFNKKYSSIYSLFHNCTCNIHILNLWPIHSGLRKWLTCSLFAILCLVAVLLNGLACKDPKMVDANDFSSSGLHIAGNTSNPAGSKLTPMTAALIPGLNSLGISLVHSDYAPWGINPPHTHPRATEILIVLEGSLEVGFFMSNPQNRLITKVLQKGDVFVFPIGLIHYQRNVGIGNVIAIAALSSQNPGVITIANAVFGSKPHIPSDILMKAFQVDNNVISNIQSKF